MTGIPSASDNSRDRSDLMTVRACWLQDVFQRCIRMLLSYRQLSLSQASNDLCIGRPKPPMSPDRSTTLQGFRFTTRSVLRMTHTLTLFSVRSFIPVVFNRTVLSHLRSAYIQYG